MAAANSRNNEGKRGFVPLKTKKTENVHLPSTLGKLEFQWFIGSCRRKFQLLCSWVLLILLGLYQRFYSFFSSPFLSDYSTYSQAAAQQG